MRADVVPVLSVGKVVKFSKIVYPEGGMVKQDQMRNNSSIYALSNYRHTSGAASICLSLSKFQPLRAPVV